MPVVQADELRELTAACFRAAGCPMEDAAQMARLMVLSNLRGHDSHGVRQLPRYLENIRAGRTLANPEIKVVSETPTTATLDADRALGHVAATRAAVLGIAKARAQRISAVTVRNLDHIGRVGAYPEMAVAEGMIAICFTSAPGVNSIVTPFGGIQGRLTTNPISVGIPNPDGDPILVDFATSIVAGNKVRVALDRGQPTGEGWLIDLEGNAVRDPQAFVERKAVILPLGGAEKGYKGYALAVIVEILAGILSGTGTFATVEDRERTNNVSFLITIDPMAFVARDFYEREVRALVDYLHATRVRPGDPAVMIPGEYEERSQRQREAEGIELEEPVWQAIQEAAARLNVNVAAPLP